MFKNQLSWEQMPFFILVACSKGCSLTVPLCMCQTDTETYRSLASSLVFNLNEKGSEEYVCKEKEMVWDIWKSVLTVATVGEKLKIIALTNSYYNLVEIVFSCCRWWMKQMFPTVTQSICCNAGTHCYFPHSFSGLLWGTQEEFTHFNKTQI